MWHGIAFGVIVFGLNQISHIHICCSCFSFCFCFCCWPVVSALDGISLMAGPWSTPRAIWPMYWKVLGLLAVYVNAFYSVIILLTLLSLGFYLSCCHCGLIIFRA